jgi:hypothetical protein
VSNLLECIERLLPAAVTLDPNLDTSEYHLFSTPEIYAELDYVAILEAKRLRFTVGLTKSYVI